MEELTSILDGMRQRLIPVGILIFAGMIVSYLFLDPVLKKISLDLLPEEMKLIALDPLEVILLKLKIAVICGVIVALPLIIYYILKVVDERIRPIDFSIKKSNLAVIVIIAIILFTVGASYSYFLMLPIFFGYMYHMALEAGVTSTWSIAPFINFVVMITAVFGVVFELPLILTILVRRDIVKLETLKKYRRHAYVGLLVLSAFITSPDVFTQIIIGVPLITFYEVSIFVAGFSSVESEEYDNTKLGNLAFTNSLILGAGVMIASFGILFLHILPSYPQFNVALLNNSTIFMNQIDQFRLLNGELSLPLIIPSLFGILAGFRTRKISDENLKFNAAIFLFFLAGALWGLMFAGILTEYSYLMPILIGLGTTVFCAGMLTSHKQLDNSVSISLIIPVGVFLITLLFFLYQETSTLVIGLAIIGAISILSGKIKKSNFQKG